MRKRALLIVLVGVAFAIVGVASLTSGAQDVNTRRTLVHNGARRSYVVRIPRLRDDDARKRPLVLVFHGGGGNAANAEEMTGFTEKAQREGFIVVYPEGSSRFRRALLTWNAGHCCGYAMEQRVDDVGFINALLDALIATYPIDPARVFATGMSNGAMMSHRIGIELSHRVAAVAPVVGAVFGDEPRPRGPVSAIIFNGMLDRSVPVQGGRQGGRFAKEWDGTPPKPALAQAAFWAAANGCAGTPAVREQEATVVHRFTCPPGRAVELHIVKDNGHAWPGGKAGTRRGDTPSTAIDATDVIWKFFSEQAPRPKDMPR